MRNGGKTPGKYRPINCGQSRNLRRVDMISNLLTNRTGLGATKASFDFDLSLAQMN
jgi:hypothetical protein